MTLRRFCMGPSFVLESLGGVSAKGDSGRESEVFESLRAELVAMGVAEPFPIASSDGWSRDLGVTMSPMTLKTRNGQMRN